MDRLFSIEKRTLLRHGCTHIAEWLEPTINKRTRVTLKKIVDEQDTQLFDFYRVTCLLANRNEYPEI